MTTDRASVGVIVVQVVAMYQSDRQYSQIQDIKQQNDLLARDMARVQQRLRLIP